MNVWGGIGMLEETNSRGAITADFDNSGRLDLVFNHPFSKPTFLKNREILPGNSWAGLILQGNGVTCNRDAIGTRVELSVSRSDGSNFKLSSEVQMVSGLLAQSDRRLHFGLGKKPTLIEASIYWCGQKEQKINLKANQYQTVVEP